MALTAAPFFIRSARYQRMRISQAQVGRSRNHNVYSIAPRGINLPSSLALTREKVAYVADRLREILAAPAIHETGTVEAAVGSAVGCN